MASRRLAASLLRSSLHRSPSRSAITHSSRAARTRPQSHPFPTGYFLNRAVNYATSAGAAPSQPPAAPPVSASTDGKITDEFTGVGSIGQVSSPTLIVERAGSNAWTHKSWRVREEFARTVTSAIGLFASTELPLQRAILPPILQMLYDPNPGVREAVILFIEEMYAQIGPQFREELHRQQLPSSMVKDINARLERIEPKQRPSDIRVNTYPPAGSKSSNHNPKRSSPKAKTSSREVSLFGGENDITEKPVDPIKVYSEKD